MHALQARIRELENRLENIGTLHLQESRSLKAAKRARHRIDSSEMVDSLVQVGLSLSESEMRSLKCKCAKDLAGPRGILINSRTGVLGSFAKRAGNDGATHFNLTPPHVSNRMVPHEQVPLLHRLIELAQQHQVPHYTNERYLDV